MAVYVWNEEKGQWTDSATWLVSLAQTVWRAAQLGAWRHTWKLRIWDSPEPWHDLPAAAQGLIAEYFQDASEAASYQLETRMEELGLDEDDPLYMSSWQTIHFGNETLDYNLSTSHMLDLDPSPPEPSYSVELKSHFFSPLPSRRRWLSVTWALPEMPILRGSTNLQDTPFQETHSVLHFLFDGVIDAKNEEAKSSQRKAVRTQLQKLPQRSVISNVSEIDAAETTSSYVVGDGEDQDNHHGDEPDDQDRPPHQLPGQSENMMGQVHAQNQERKPANQPGHHHDCAYDEDQRHGANEDGVGQEVGEPDSGQLILVVANLALAVPAAVETLPIQAVTVDIGLCTIA